MNKTDLLTYCTLFIISCLSVAIAQPLLAQPSAKGYLLLYEDNFGGKNLNESDWNYRLDPRVSVLTD